MLRSFRNELIIWPDGGQDLEVICLDILENELICWSRLHFALFWQAWLDQLASPAHPLKFLSLLPVIDLPGRAQKFAGRPRGRGRGL